MDRATILEALFRALDEVNENRAATEKLPRTESTALRGADASMNSLELVNFIVFAEENLEEKTGLTVDLADDPGLWQDSSSFSTIGALVDYVQQRLSRQSAV